MSKFTNPLKDILLGLSIGVSYWAYTNRFQPSTGFNLTTMQYTDLMVTRLEKTKISLDSALQNTKNNSLKEAIESLDFVLLDLKDNSFSQKIQKAINSDNQQLIMYCIEKNQSPTKN